MTTARENSSKLMDRSVRILLTALLVLPVPVAPASIVVDDSCSLVDAINAANSDTAVGGCPAGSGADTLTLTADVVLIAVDNNTDGDNALPSITSKITLEGADHTIARDDAADFGLGLFHVGSTGNLTLRSATVGNGYRGIFNRGHLALESSSVVDNYGYGGLNNLGGTAVIVGSTISGNAAYSGAGISNYDSGSVTVQDSVVRDNLAIGSYAVSYVGGVLNGCSDCSLTISGSTLSGNRAFFTGGIGNRGVLAITDSTVTDNRAAYGGGLTNSGTATITNSTLSANGFGLEAGGILNRGSGTVLLANSTLSGNDAFYSGSSIDNEGDATSVTLVNSLVGHPVGANHCAGPVVDGGNNLADDSTCGTIPTGLMGLDPVLADNGGRTRTHALLAGSNAIDLAGLCGLAADQRGYLRDDHCDSGAYEFGAHPPFSGSVEGLDTRWFVCHNRTTGQRVRVFQLESVWDCSAAGLEVDPGDQINVKIGGIRP